MVIGPPKSVYSRRYDHLKLTLVETHIELYLKENFQLNFVLGILYYLNVIHKKLYNQRIDIDTHE